MRPLHQGEGYKTLLRVRAKRGFRDPIKGDPSIASLSAPHGERRSYRKGCRCLPCRAANAEYEKRRSSDQGTSRRVLWVDAVHAYLRLFELRAQGVGYRQVAKLAGLSPREIIAIARGRQTRIEPATEAAILGVKAVLAHGSHVTGWREWRLIGSLRKEGFSDAEIARRLGNQTPKLQLHRRLTVRNALRVRSLYQRVNLEGPDLP